MDSNKDPVYSLILEKYIFCSTFLAQMLKLLRLLGN